MKKLLFSMFFVMAFIFTGCVNNDEEAVKPAEEMSGEVPHFYGLAMLENENTTRGVADGHKIWNRIEAEHGLTVKFLDNRDEDTEELMDLIIETAKEWEKHAGVKFHWVDKTENALIRIKLDTYLKTSWSYTGTDVLSDKLKDKQNVPTMLFADILRAGEEIQRSSILRAFGQALGLELEFRHPDFTPGWDLSKVQDYWEKELANFIDWSEIKKFVVDPLSSQTSLIAKTAKYDSLSVMTWPLYKVIAENIPVTKLNSDYKTELSEGDKKFIKQLYGEPLRQTPKEYLPLIEFTFTGTAPGFTLTTAEDIFVIWDEPADELTWIKASNDSQSISHIYDTAKERTIKIAMEIPDETVETSYSLLKFDITMGSNAKDIVVHNCNKALESVWITGGYEFKKQLFDFTGFDALKELYLVWTLDSRAIINNCPNLLAFGTSYYIWAPEGVSLPGLSEIYSPEDSGTIYFPPRWPNAAERYHSLSNTDGMGLQITNCDNLKYLSLENTRIITVDLADLYRLEYLYISSANEYIVGGPTLSSIAGIYLQNSIATITNRNTKTTGYIVIRGVSLPPAPPVQFIYLPFCNVPMASANYYSINSMATSRNWNVVWYSGVTFTQ